MRESIINFNGINVKCYEDGSIDRVNLRSGRINRTFGTYHTKGYRQVTLGGKTIKTHRLIAEAFLEEFSEELQVDHIDGDKENNRPSNLRMVTNKQNCRAAKRVKDGASSKYRGVTWNKARKKWVARIGPAGSMFVGSFDDEVEAALQWNVAARNIGYSLEALNQI